MRTVTPKAPPLDLEGVRAHCRQLLADGKTEEAIEQLLRLVASVTERNTALEIEFQRMLRKHLGKTSERVSDDQLSFLTTLLGATGTAPAPAPDAPLAPPDVELPRGDEPQSPKKKRGHGRRPLPSHLPRVEVEHRVPDAERPCPSCGADRVCIGHETSEVLEFVPASFRIEEHRREKLACRKCEEGFTTAPAPDKVIEKGRPGPGLLAQVVVAKYADHLPLHRQRAIYLRDGVDLPVSTLADWVAAFHESVVPLVVRIGELALESHVLQADDTGIKVLDRDAPGGARRGHLWCYVGDETWSVYRFTPDWTKEGPQAFLRTRRGWLVADAYKGYDGLFVRDGATAVEVACWAHARRPFAELALAGDPRAAPAVEWCRALYDVERRATEEAVSSDERLRRRQVHSAPVVEQFISWCRSLRERTPPSDPLAKGAGYVLNQSRALRRFLEDGRLPIDNTLVERRLRPIATGRKNYLFCGSDVGADRAASAYTLLGCCALAGLDPRAYLTWLLVQLETRRFPASRIDELLPIHWAQSCPESARVPTSR